MTFQLIQEITADQCNIFLTHMPYIHSDTEGNNIFHEKTLKCFLHPALQFSFQKCRKSYKDKDFNSWKSPPISSPTLKTGSYVLKVQRMHTSSCCPTCTAHTQYFQGINKDMFRCIKKDGLDGNTMYSVSVLSSSWYHLCFNFTHWEHPDLTPSLTLQTLTQGKI